MFYPSIHIPTMFSAIALFLATDTKYGDFSMDIMKPLIAHYKIVAVTSGNNNIFTTMLFCLIKCNKKSHRRPFFTLDSWYALPKLLANL